MGAGRTTAFAVIGLALIDILSASVFAAEQAEFVNFLSDPTQRQHVISGAARSTVILQNPCPTAQFSIEKRFVIYKQPTFDNTGNIGDGAWKQTVDEQGCGTNHVLNVLVSAEGPNNVSVAPLLPGTTRADPLLQKDAVGLVVQAVATVPGGREPNCQIGYIANTEFVAQENVTLEGAKRPSWRELWTLVSCTQKMLVPMRFIPDATGTSITAGPSTAIKVAPLKESSP